MGAPAMNNALLSFLFLSSKLNWAAFCKKVPNVLSRCHTKKKKFFSKKSKKSVSYQKKDGRAGPRPPFFWYDNDSGHKEPFRGTQPT